MRKSGFTLAEVLVTLGIIGVVAALTMPQMTARTQNMQLETATLKYYSQIQEAVQRHLVQNGLDELDASFDGAKFIEENFKTVLKCEPSIDCFVEESKDLNGNTIRMRDFTSYGNPAYVLNGGAVLQVKNGSTPIVIIDTNGVKGPNILNRDLWQLQLRTDGTLVDRKQGTTPEEIETNLESCLSDGDAYGCFAHFVKNGFKFDY